MLTVYYSNRLEVLSKSLATALRYSDASVFEAPQILVQSQGMSRWINTQLAAELGIAANLEFPYPSSFIWSLYSQLFDLAEENPFNKPLLVWRIMLLLQELQGSSEFAAVRSYLKDDDGDLKRYQLAGVIADIFDQYLMYRPHWLAAWEGRLDPQTSRAIGLRLEQNNHTAWQKELWLKLLEHVMAGISRLTTYQGHEPSYGWHRARVSDEFFQSVKAPEFQRRLQSILPKQLYVFSISALPQVFLNTISVLVDYIDIHFFVLSPSHEYWGDIKSLKQQAHETRLVESQGGLNENLVGNDLLAAWGKVGRQQHEMLQIALSHCEIKEYELYQPWNEHGLLQALQNDWLSLSNRYQNQDEKVPLTIEQINLGVHCCHSKMRELEVLHDQLLHFFDVKQDLKPKDIVVMVPDVDSYAPYIEAVFGSKSGLQKVPYAIADRNGIQEHALLQAFFQLLDMAEGDFTLAEVFTLLEYPVVQSRFGFQDYEQVKRWLEKANIRFGLSREQHQEQGIDEETFSWQYGLKRLLLGYIASPDNTCGLSGLPHLENIAPVSDVSGIAAQDVGRLAEFIEQLEYLQTLSVERVAEQWVQTFEHLLESFFRVEQEDEVLLQLVRASISALHRACDQTGFNNTISFAVIREYLHGDISLVSQGQHFLSGKVNFCTLMPMRSIPFRFVALLGMNDGAFPRQQDRPSFDLFAMEACLGDRNRREDDRYLFLEAVLSARDYLYLSYVGRSIKDNSVQEPSLLLSELLDYIEVSYSLDVGAVDNKEEKSLLSFVCFEHALQTFDPQYFTAKPAAGFSENSYFTYAHQWLPAVQKNNADASEAAPFFNQALSSDMQALPIKTMPLALSLHTLQQFFTHPARYLLSQVVPMSLDFKALTLAEAEPFELTGLDKYYLIDELLHTDLEGQDVQGKIREFQARGELALSGFGKIQAHQLLQNVKLMRDACHFDSDEAGMFSHIKLDYMIELADDTSFSLSGVINSVLPKRLLRWRSSKENPAFLLSCWLEHLALCIMDQGRDTQVIFQGGESWQFGAIAHDEAVHQLQQYIAMYRDAHQAARFFAPKAGFSYMCCLQKEVSKGTALEMAKTLSLNEARTSFYGVQKKYPEYDVWYRQLFNGLEPEFDDDFACYAELVFKELLNHAEKLPLDEAS